MSSIQQKGYVRRSAYVTTDASYFFMSGYYSTAVILHPVFESDDSIIPSILCSNRALFLTHVLEHYVFVKF